MTIPPATPGPWVEQWLSAGRFKTYLSAAGGGRSKALGHYEWSAACLPSSCTTWRTLKVVEVFRLTGDNIIVVLRF